jgi:hypothetical protein
VGGAFTLDATQVATGSGGGGGGCAVQGDRDFGLQVVGFPLSGVVYFGTINLYIINKGGTFA